MATPGVKVSPTAPKRQLYWRNILFLSSTALFAILVTPYYLYETGMTWGLFFLWAISSAMTSLSITAGYHRYLSHRSYDARAAVKIGYLLFGAAAFQGSALQWAADHRRHHRLVDTDDDPHNINEGFFHAHMGWLFRKEDPRFAKRFPPDLLKDKLVMWQAKHYEWIAISMGFVLPTLIGWSMGSPFGGLLFGGVLRVVFTNHSTFFINSLAHTLGRRTYNSQQTARDSVVMALLAFGEGYHNFHHAFAADYRNGIRWYHYDPTKWVIKLLSLCGMTYRLKIVPASEILRVRLQNE